jgi:2'-5' RNA ligase
MKRGVLRLGRNVIQLHSRSMNYAAALKGGNSTTQQRQPQNSAITHSSAQPQLSPPAATPLRPVFKMGSNAHKRQDSGVPTDGTVTRPTPNPFHKPSTSQNEEAVYVLTLSLTPSISVPLDQLRTQYFPNNLNRTPAHITLFHALPHSLLPRITSDLETITSRTHPYHISTGRPFRLRKGVAVNLDSGAESSEHLREEMREKWVEALSEQDRRAWQPHWTVMNKVDEERKVEAAFNTIRRMLYEDAQHGKVVGIVLWRYVVGGRWEEVREFGFQGGAKTLTPDKQKGEAYSDIKTREAGSEGSKNPEVVKRAGSAVAGMWKAVTKKKGARLEQER